MTVVTGRVIIPPSLKLDGNLSVEGKPVEHWAILDFTDDEHDNITNFIEALRHKFTSLGINIYGAAVENIQVGKFRFTWLIA